MSRTVIISDTHFGDGAESLVKADKIEALCEKIESLDHVNYLVLLGDIWDLWKTDIHTSFERSLPFTERISEVKNVDYIVIVAGNHDHHLFMRCYENEVNNKIRSRVLKRPDFLRDRSYPSPFLSSLFPGFPKDRIVLRYPEFRTEAVGKTVVMTHGHYIDHFSRHFWWAKTSFLSRLVQIRKKRRLRMRDMECNNTPFFEMLSMAAYSPDLVHTEYRLYAVIKAVSSLLRLSDGKSSKRFTSITDNSREIEMLLRALHSESMPSIFVYGHTHKAELEEITIHKKPVIAINSGCWLEDAKDATPNTIVIIDDHIEIAALGKTTWETLRRIDLKDSVSVKGLGRRIKE